MRYLYTLCFRLAIPIILLRLLWRSKRLPAYRDRWLERFGYFPAPAKKGGIWIHAVSFGESILAIPLIKHLHATYPDETIIVTNMTPTGSEKIRATFGKTVFNVYAPYDLPGIMRRFIKKTQPKLVIIIETELWPNMLHLLKKHHILVLLANGRLSASSAANYQKIRGMTSKMLQSFSRLLVQTKVEAERYIALGCPPELIEVTGSMKFDINISDHVIASATLLRKELGEQRPIIIAASTHEGEEEILLEAFKIVQQEIPDILLVLVPRHPDRFEKIAAYCVEKNFKIVRRSSKKNCSSETDIFLGDTMGELLLFYAAADIAFVGGSLVSVGGHNVLEPAALAKAIIVGPHMENFLQITALLKKDNGIIQIASNEELIKSIIELIQLPSLRDKLGRNAEQVVLSNRGALAKHIAVIDSLYLKAL